MKYALIWGASGGIGHALTTLLLEHDWSVLGIARRDAPLHGLPIETYAADVSREHDVAAAAHWAAQHTDAIDLWVYAAGDIQAATLNEMSPADWQRIMAANFDGARYAVHHSLPLVKPGGLLVLSGAYVSSITLPRLGAYVAAKAALEAYTGVLAKEVRDRRISLLRMGAVDTPLWNKVPFKPPKNGMRTAASVAEAIHNAYMSGHKGPLDL